MATIREQAAAIKGYAADIDAAIIAKGGSTEGGLKHAAAAIKALPTGGGEVADKSDVNFYLPDGKIVKSFTNDAFLDELNKDGVASLKDIVPMPALDGLTAQDWNWSKSTWATTKEKLIDQLDKRGKVDIGGMYVTDNGETRLYLHITEDVRLTQLLQFGRSGGTSIVVDWGDGTSDTYTHTSQTQVSHTYPSKGDYVIRMSSVGAAKILVTGSSTTNIFGSTRTSESNPALVYTGRLTKVELGSNCTSIGSYTFNACHSLSSVVIPQGVTSIGGYTFIYCYSLSSVVIPQGVTSIGGYTFNSCYSLSSVVIPQGVTSIGMSAFNSCYSLSSVVIPQGVTSIGMSAFSYCYSLSSVVIPQGVTSIGVSAFSYCDGIAVYDFTAATFVPALSNENAFANIATDCKIVVPDALYDDWCAATNWSSATTVSHIVPEGRYARMYAYGAHGEGGAGVKEFVGYVDPNIVVTPTPLGYFGEGTSAVPFTLHVVSPKYRSALEGADAIKFAHSTRSGSATRLFADSSSNPQFFLYSQQAGDMIDNTKAWMNLVHGSADFWCQVETGVPYKTLIS